MGKLALILAGGMLALMQAVHALEPAPVYAVANAATASEYERGYADGKQFCVEDPVACGIAQPVFENGLLGIPMVVVPGLGCFDVKLRLVDAGQFVFALNFDSIKDVPGCKKNLR